MIEQKTGQKREMKNSHFEILQAGYQLLKNSQTELDQQLNAGLILALGGFVQSISNNSWKVKKYTISRDNHWHCNCPQGQSYAPHKKLYGYTGHICKHICAVCICLSVSCFPPKSGNVWELITRMVNNQIVLNFDLPNCKIKTDGELTLKKGRLESQPLAIFDEQWQWVENAKEVYNNFVEQCQNE